MASSRKFMRDSFMNCDKLFRVWNLNLVHGLFMKVIKTVNCAMANYLIISQLKQSELDYQP